MAEDGGRDRAESPASDRSGAEAADIGATDGGDADRVTVSFEGDRATGVDGAAVTGDDPEGAVAGSFSPDLEVTPGRPSPENVVFVALGVYIATLALGRMFLGDDLYAPLTLGLITVGLAGATALLYGLFRRTDPDT